MGGALLRVEQDVREGTSIHGPFGKQANTRNEGKGKWQVQYVSAYPMSCLWDMNPELSRCYSFVSLRPITTYKIVSGGVRTQ